MLNILLSTTWVDASDKDLLAFVTRSSNMVNAFRKVLCDHFTLSWKLKLQNNDGWSGSDHLTHQFSPSEFYLARFLRCHRLTSSRSLCLSSRSVSSFCCKLRAFISSMACFFSRSLSWAFGKIGHNIIFRNVNADDFCKYPQIFTCKESGSENQSISIVF